MTLPSLHSACPRSHDRSRVVFVRVPPGAGRGEVREHGYGSHVVEWGEKDDPYGLIALIKIKWTNSLPSGEHPVTHSTISVSTN
jgi:hypothetical protein